MEETRYLVSKYLDNLGMKCTHSGYYYWIDSITYCLENEIPYIGLHYDMGYLYRLLSKQNHINKAAIERSLRYAREQIKELKDKLGVNYKLNNSTFLILLIKEIKNKENLLKTSYKI